MEENFLVRRLWFWLLACLPGVRSYVEFVVAAFQYLEVAFLICASLANVNLVCIACFTLGMLPDSFGAQLHSTASHVEWKE